jgi:putative flippase GtrA
MVGKMKEFVRVLKFVFFSISAGLIEMGSFALLTENTSLPYWPRYLIALVLSIIWNFTLNRKFTFQSSNNVPKAMFQVFMFYLVFTPLSTMLGNYLTSIGWNDYLVTGINMLLNLVTEFLYQRYYVFRDSIDTKVVKI